MNIRRSPVATGLLVLAALVLFSQPCWAIRQGLPPSKDEYGLQYDVTVNDTGGDTLTVVFTLTDEGRLKPFYSVDLVAFSKQTDSQGGRSYDLQVPVKLQGAAEGKRTAEVELRKEFLDRAKIRIITLTVDGKRQPSGGVFYDIPIKKYLNKLPGAAPSVAAPPAKKATR